MRIIRQNDPGNKHATRYSMKHFRALFLAGEHCDRDTLLWGREIFADKPVIDHYWQTETGSPVTAVCLGLEKHPVMNIQKEVYFLKNNSFFIEEFWSSWLCWTSVSWL